MGIKKAILAVDPGLESGVAFMVWSGVKGEDPVIQYSDELGPDDYATPLRDFLCEWESYDQFEVACERFTITIDTAKKAQAPYSLEQIGVLKQICRDYGFPVENIKLQTPADAKNMFPNKALHTLNQWHVGGAGHALDAIRHGLLLAVKVYRWQPLALLEGIEE